MFWKNSEIYQSDGCRKAINPFFYIEMSDSQVENQLLAYVEL